MRSRLKQLPKTLGCHPNACATLGEYYWGGAASTAFFVNPEGDLVMIFLTQLRPSSTYPIRRELRATIYSALLE